MCSRLLTCRVAVLFGLLCSPLVASTARERGVASDRLIRGTAVDSEGNPVPNAEVFWSPFGAPSSSFQKWEVEYACRRGERARFDKFAQQRMEHLLFVCHPPTNLMYIRIASGRFRPAAAWRSVLYRRHTGRESPCSLCSGRRASFT